MFKPENFFSLKDNLFASLFAGTEHTWDVLKKLPVFCREFIKGNVARIRNGQIFIPQTIIFYEDEVITGNFSIDATQKPPQVIFDGKILEGASIIYAGAVLMNDEIYLGKSTVIEHRVLTLMGRPISGILLKCAKVPTSGEMY